MFWINALFVVLPIGLTFGETRTFSFTANDVCYEQYNDVISDVEDIMSLTSCSVLCAKDDCCSFMFNAESQRCITSSAYAGSFNESECGWKYVEIDKNECNTPVKTLTYVCNDGNSLEPRSQNCVQHCEVYGTTFGVYDKYYIGQASILELIGLDITLCLQACINLNSTEYTCRAAAYYNADCRLTDSRHISTHFVHLPYDNVTLYVRNCA